MRRREIEQLLPSVFQASAAGGDKVLVALLDVMEALHERAEACLGGLGDLFAPHRTPDEFVPYLARWMAVDHLVGGAQGEPTLHHDTVPVERLRDLVTAAAVLARWRGTANGLRLALRLVTGVHDFTIEEPRDFHLVVHVPRAAAGHLPLIARLVAAEKPAATTCEIVEPEPQPAPAPESAPQPAPAPEPESEPAGGES